MQSFSSDEAIEPWGITADAEVNHWLSEKFRMSLVQFAQAWHEDMIACFVAGTGSDPKVVISNPWAETCVDREWQKTGTILEEFTNFSTWLEWVRDSDLVRLYAEHRIERK